MGTFVLHQRAYYHCTTCHAGHCPADDAFGLGASDLTAGAEQLAVLFGTTASFAEAAERLLPKASGLRLAESTVERATEAAGRSAGPGHRRRHDLRRGGRLGVARGCRRPERGLRERRRHRRADPGPRRRRGRRSDGLGRQGLRPQARGPGRGETPRRPVPPPKVTPATWPG